MTTRRRNRYARLLRWYPAVWRRANGQVMLDTLEQAADAQGRLLPASTESWSIRAHGLVERATPATIAGVAGVALALSTIPVGALWTGAFGSAPWLFTLTIAAQYGGALAASIAAGALVVRTGLIPAEQALIGAAAAILAWTFGALITTSWSVGFDEADAGTGLSWFGSATLLFAGLAWIFGILALLPLTLAPFRQLASRAVAWALAVGIAAVGALAFGIMGILPSGAILMSSVMLVVASRSLPPTQHTQRTRQSRPATRTPLSLRRRRQLAVVAAAAAIMGLSCAAFALTGSLWGIDGLDATETVRIGILFGSIVSIVTVAASAVALFARVGLPIAGAATALISALVMVALSYSLHGNAPAGWTLLVLAGLATGLAGGILFIPLLPGRWWLRALLVLGIATAIAATVGLQGIVMATFITPVAAIVLTVMMARRPRSAKGARDLAPVSAS